MIFARLAPLVLLLMAAIPGSAAPAPADPISVAGGRLVLDAAEPPDAFGWYMLQPIQVDRPTAAALVAQLQGAPLCEPGSRSLRQEIGCMPELVLVWGDTVALAIAALPSDTLLVEVRELETSESRELGWILVPEFSEAARAAMGWTPFTTRGDLVVHQVEIRGIEQGECVLDDERTLEMTTEGLQRIQPECPTACPFWIPVRITTSEGVVLGLLAADGCSTALLAWATPELEAAWQGDRMEYRAALQGRAQECWMPQSVYDQLMTAARSRGVPVVPGEGP